MTKPAHLVLTDRDVQILMMIYSFGGCTAEHVQRRFFPTKGGRSACYARIAKLIQADYITTIRLPSLHGVGSGKSFLTPGPKGRAVLAEILRLSRTELARVRADSPLFIQHHLALCDLRLAVELECERSEVFHLQEWMGDHELRQTPIKVTDPASKKVFSFVPAASFNLVLPDGSEQTLLVEMDLSTLSPKRCREKLRCYLIQAKKHPAPVLFVAPDDSRVGALAKWAAEEANKLKSDPTIFWLSASHRINEKTVLSEPIWLLPGGPKALALESLVPEPRRSAAPLGEVVFAGGLAL